MRAKYSFIIAVLACLITLSNLSSCKKLVIVTATTDDVNIYDYLVKDPGSFSEFAKLIDKAGYSSFLNAYGSYTVFAPTNEGVKKFLTDMNKTSVDAFTLTEAQDIVKLHLIQDTINTSSFTDGKLPKITMLGQYLLTGVTTVNGVSSYIVNRQALIVQPNVRLANGNIHVLDNVLRAATKTVAQTVEANPEFSIFTQALKETGYFDSLNIVNNPDSSLSFWLSIIPFTSPIAMMVRLPFGVPMWELGLSIALLIGGFILTTWVASRIYRVGILMYGKKVSFKELGKWFMYRG